MVSEALAPAAFALIGARRPLRRRPTTTRRRRCASKFDQQRFDDDCRNESEQTRKMLSTFFTFLQELSGLMVLVAQKGDLI